MASWPIPPEDDRSEVEHNADVANRPRGALTGLPYDFDAVPELPFGEDYRFPFNSTTTGGTLPMGPLADRIRRGSTNGDDNE